MSLWQTAAYLFVKVWERTPADAVLLEDGDRLLTEDLFYFLLE